MTRACDDSIASGRMSKANQFLQSADDVGELADDEAEVRDAVVTLLVHASIAAADVVCCKRIGQYAIGGDSHSDAIGLLRTVKQPDGSALAKRLKQVLDVKTKAAYTHRSVTAAERRRAQRAAEELVRAARDLR